jgi:proton glutamate symport protein
MKQGLFVLLALVLGVIGGALIRAGAPLGLADLAGVVASLGDVWLAGLQMTLVPLIVAVLVSSIAGLQDTLTAGRQARRALIAFSSLILLAGTFSILATQALLAIWPVAPESAMALVAAAGAATDTAGAAPIGLGDWLKSLVPTNVVKAAAEGAILPLVLFACVFGFAAGSLPADRRAPVTGFFAAVADTMLVVIGWVLALAPLGVFGLALSLGLNTGLEAVGALGQYLAVVCAVTIASIVIIALAGALVARAGPPAFLRGLAPVAVIAASTQSSVASLPAMLASAMGPLAIPAKLAEFALPLAVAMFRFTSPVANLAVALFLAHVNGVEPSVSQLLAALLVAFAVSVSSVGLPGQSSFFASVAPICLALGVPVTVLPLLLALEVIPDIFRTIGNVTADLSVTAGLDRVSGLDSAAIAWRMFLYCSAGRELDP